MFPSHLSYGETRHGTGRLENADTPLRRPAAGVAGSDRLHGGHRTPTRTPRAAHVPKHDLHPAAKATGRFHATPRRQEPKGLVADDEWPGGVGLVFVNRPRTSGRHERCRMRFSPWTRGSRRAASRYAITARTAATAIGRHQRPVVGTPSGTQVTSRPSAPGLLLACRLSTGVVPVTTIPSLAPETSSRSRSSSPRSSSTSGEKSRSSHKAGLLYCFSPPGHRYGAQKAVRRSARTGRPCVVAVVARRVLTLVSTNSRAPFPMTSIRPASARMGSAQRLRHGLRCLQHAPDHSLYGPSRIVGCIIRRPLPHRAVGGRTSLLHLRIFHQTILHLVCATCGS